VGNTTETHSWKICCQLSVDITASLGVFRHPRLPFLTREKTHATIVKRVKRVTPLERGRLIVSDSKHLVHISTHTRVPTICAERHGINVVPSNFARARRNIRVIVQILEALANTIGATSHGCVNDGILATDDARDIRIDGASVFVAHIDSASSHAAHTTSSNFLRVTIAAHASEIRVVGSIHITWIGHESHRCVARVWTTSFEALTAIMERVKGKATRERRGLGEGDLEIVDVTSGAHVPAESTTRRHAHIVSHNRLRASSNRWEVGRIEETLTRCVRATKVLLRRCRCRRGGLVRSGRVCGFHHLTATQRSGCASIGTSIRAIRVNPASATANECHQLSVRQRVLRIDGEDQITGAHRP